MNSILHGLMKFNVSHISFNEIRAHEQDFLGAEYKSTLGRLASRGQAWSLFYNDRAISFFGAFHIWHGVMELWQIPTKHVDKSPKFYSKQIKFLIDKHWEYFKLHRMQSTCLDDVLHNRWMRFLGFKKEGTLKKYNWNEQDYAIFAKVR